MESIGYTLERDVRPGEAVFFGLDGRVVSQLCHDSPILSPCIFEFVYFGRPDSTIDEVSIYHARQLMGNYLADKIKREQNIEEIDVVVPVPDTSRISALQCALRLNLPYEEGLTKNRYIARTFIMPGQKKRTQNVRKKLNPITKVFQGKNVLLVDDSIVRGTTSREIIDMCRSAGANKVFFCSASPPIIYQNVYGIDMPNQSELVAFNRTLTEVAEYIGADWVVYQDLADLEQAVKSLNPNISRFDCSCFCGDYVTKVAASYLQELNEARSNDALQAANRNLMTRNPALGDADDADLAKPTSSHNILPPPPAQLIHSPIFEAEGNQDEDTLEDLGPGGELPAASTSAPPQRGRRIAGTNFFSSLCSVGSLEAISAQG